MTVHKGQQLAHKTETDWPTITVQSVHTTDLPAFAGNRVAPFAWVKWSDDDSSTTIPLAQLERDWQDTGV